MSGVDYRTLLDAFQPAKEITDPRRFSGRRAQVEKGSELLLSRVPLFLHGNRGVGKSSLARQLELIASGHTELLGEIGSHLAEEKFDFATVFLTRDDSINNINSLLYRLLIDKSALTDWYELLNLPPVGTYDLEGTLNPTLVSEFWSRAKAAATLGKDGLLIAIDEFERIRDQSGFASLLKSRPENIVFLITGIGKTERDLVRDHLSIERQLDEGKLHVPPMSEDELRHIVRRAEEEIDRTITFGEQASEQLVKLSQGQPYLLHLIGKYSLVRAFREKQRIVTPEIITDALNDVANSKASFLEDRYLRAIGNSEQRETTLRVFAEGSSETAVSTALAYPRAKELGVGNPSYYIGDLQKEQYGSEIEKVGEQYYRFKDPLFRAYVAATPRHLVEQSNEVTDTNVASQIRILHISDIHFGTTHYFSSLPIYQDNVPTADKPRASKYINDAIVGYPAGRHIDIVVLSGDITQTAAKREFDDASRFVSDLLPAVIKEESRHERLVVVPGNHDVNWAIANADPSSRSLPFASYLQFAIGCGAKFSSDIEPERIYRVHDYRARLGCIVVALNSAVIETPDDHRGYIGESQVTNALQEVSELDPRNEFVKIAVFHHHLVPVGSLEEDHTKPDELMRDAAYIKSKLLDANFSLALHGHRHHGFEELVGNGKAKLVIVGCGSTGVVNKERGSQPLAFNILTIQREPPSIDVRRFSFDSTRRQFLPSADHEKSFII